MGHGLFTAKETTSTKNIILNAFLMRDFYFKRRAGKLLSLRSDHLTRMQERVPEKNALSQLSICGQMRC